MKNIKFQNREKVLAEIYTNTDPPLLINVCGEGGIGKTRLLEEAKQRLSTKSPPVLVLYVDLGDIPTGQPEVVLRSLIAEAHGQLRVTKKETTQMAGQIVSQLSVLTESMSVYLMFDTTEKLQEDMEFWQWMEANLVGPIVVEGRVRQVFAGRIPVPWRRPEVRRTVKLLPLEPLAVETDARKLIQEILRQHVSVFKDEKSLELATDLVLEFSFGHPLLSEELAVSVVSYWPVSSLDKFRSKFCEGEVKPFIEDHFLKDLEEPWHQILWWASALDWFDTTILQRYLSIVESELVEDKPDYFFIQGISRLRLQHTIIWGEERGYRLYGVVARIMRYCLKIWDPERYHQACQAAAQTLESLAKEFSEEAEELPAAQRYRQEAKTYRQRAGEKVQ